MGAARQVAWLTVDQLGGPTYPTKKEHANARVDNGMLTTRLHELNVPANMGVA